MASRYNNTLEMLVAAEATHNEVGDLVQPTPSWQFLTMCREEPTDGGTSVSTVGAKAVDLGSDIFFPADAPAVPLNAEVRVLGNDGTVLVQGKVMRYKRYRHYGKIWI